jgi:hypothetical protein
MQTVVELRALRVRKAQDEALCALVARERDLTRDTVDAEAGAAHVLDL